VTTISARKQITHGRGSVMTGKCCNLREAQAWDGMTRALRSRYVSLAKRQGNSTGNDNREEEEEEESTTINKIHHVIRHQHHNTNKLDQSQTISTMYNNDHDNLSVS